MSDNADITLRDYQLDVADIEALDDRNQETDQYYNMPDCEVNDSVGNSGAMFNTGHLKIDFRREKYSKLAEEVLKSGFIPVIVFSLLIWGLTWQLLRENVWDIVVFGLFIVLGVVFFIRPIWIKLLKYDKVDGIEAWMKRHFLLYYLIVMTVSIFLGLFIGQTIWSTYHQPYIEYKHLKWIRNPINPLLESGTAYQDAGIVAFAQDSYIDRSHSACYRTNGKSYCIVPILQDVAGIGQGASEKPGEQKTGTDDVVMPLSPTGSYDYFAVGEDCCSCPGSGDFACGDWAFNSGMSGLRQLNPQSRANFEFAVQQWESAYSVQSRQPLFFEWVSRPFDKINELKSGQDLAHWTASLIYCGIVVFLSICSHLGREAYHEAYKEEWLRDQDRRMAIDREKGWIERLGQRTLRGRIGRIGGKWGSKKDKSLSSPSNRGNTNSSTVNVNNSNLNDMSGVTVTNYGTTVTNVQTSDNLNGKITTDAPQVNVNLSQAPHFGQASSSDQIPENQENGAAGEQQREIVV